MTIYAYDTEFIEHSVYVGIWPFGRRVRTIELISIGIVAEDGREYYAVNADMPVRAIRRHEWLVKNVVPSLPRIHGDRRNHLPNGDLGIDFNSPLVKPHAIIAEEVREFLLSGAGATGGMYDRIQAWADFGSYDHVALCWLWGAMVDLPEGLPMTTFDLQQASVMFGRGIFAQESGQHNALEDARHVMRVLRLWRFAR